MLDEQPTGPLEPARLQVHYREQVVKELTQQFGYKTAMQVPRIEKIALNMGVGEAVADKKIMDNAVADMQKIAGQKPLVTKARKSIANFKIRDGYPVGCKVTLRGARMYEFLDRLVTVAMPRIRDFRGISGALLRRPRQLQHGREGTDHFPGDRVRQDRRDPRHEHHDYDHRKDRRRSARRCLRHSNFRSGTERIHGKAGIDQPRTEAPQDGQEIRRQARELFAIANNLKLAQEERYEARLKLQKLPRNASPGAGAQPLRADRPSARHVPQIRPRRATSCARSRCAARFPA